MACALPAFILLTAITASYAGNRYSDGDGYGYGGHPGYNQACVPGYGDNCVPEPTPAPFPSPTPVDRPDFVPGTMPPPVPDDSESGPGETLMPPVVDLSTERPSCKLTAPPECVFPFVYKSLTYTTCTGVDTKDTLWCSKDAVYNGKWKQCSDPCKDKWPVKAIVGSVVAGGVAVAGVGLIAAAVDHENKHPGTPFLGSSWGRRRKAGGWFAKPTPPPSAEVAVAAPVPQPPVLPPNVGVGVAAPVAVAQPEMLPPNVGVGVAVESVPVAVPGRLLGALRGPANVPVATMGPLIALAAVVSIVAAGAIYHGINRKKQKRALEQQGEQGTGYLEVSSLE